MAETEKVVASATVQQPIRYWCNTHQRPAPSEGWSFYKKYIGDGDPNERFRKAEFWVDDTTRELRQCTGGGIMIPCCVIDCEEVGIEILGEL